MQNPTLKHLLCPSRHRAQEAHMEPNNNVIIWQWLTVGSIAMLAVAVAALAAIVGGAL